MEGIAQNVIEPFIPRRDRKGLKLALGNLRDQPRVPSILTGDDGLIYDPALLELVMLYYPQDDYALEIYEELFKRSDKIEIYDIPTSMSVDDLMFSMEKEFDIKPHIIFTGIVSSFAIERKRLLQFQKEIIENPYRYSIPTPQFYTLRA